MARNIKDRVNSSTGDPKKLTNATGRKTPLFYVAGKALNAYEKRQQRKRDEANEKTMTNREKSRTRGRTSSGAVAPVSDKEVKVRGELAMKQSFGPGGKRKDAFKPTSIAAGASVKATQKGTKKYGKAR